MKLKIETAVTKLRCKFATVVSDTEVKITLLNPAVTLTVGYKDDTEEVLKNRLDEWLDLRFIDKLDEEGFRTVEVEKKLISAGCAFARPEQFN